MNINLNVKPEELRRDEYLKDKFTTPELKDLSGWKRSAGLKVLIHIRKNDITGMRLRFLL